MSNRTAGEALSWVGTVLGGAWLSVWAARCVTETMARAMGATAAGGPVRELVVDALEEHQADDTPMVHAFEEALAEETEEETADVR